ncbi:MAG: cupin domain-containing protein [Pseudomonadota bacterium]
MAISGDLGAGEIIRMLGLKPHPEGGHYAETFRSPVLDGARGALTVIYYLLQADEVSAWHKVDADEAWFWHAGGPLALTLSTPEGIGATPVQLGPELRSGQKLQVIVPVGHWQTAESLGAWTLVSCTVAPAFSFDGFELAPPDWRPDV